MIATVLRSDPVRAAATAMPRAALIEVLEWPAPKASYSLSSRLRKPLAPSGQDLVGIGLVADIPYQPVVRGVEDIVQGNGQFDRAQAGREMAAGTGNRFNQKFAQLGGELHELIARQLTQIGRRIGLAE